MTDCPICYTEITATTGQTTLGCGHTYHLRCIAQWFKNETTCPYCRAATGEYDTIAQPAEAETDDSTTASSVDYERTPLMDAAANGDLDTIRALIISGAPINAVDDAGDTAVVYAIYFSPNILDTVRLLLDLGANINQLDQEGDSYFATVCRRKHWDVAALLIERGADITLGDFPIGWIVRGDAVTVLDLLHERGLLTDATVKEKALLIAAVAGSILCLGLLLRLGTNPNCRSRARKTPLMHAVQSSCGCVEILIRYGADPFAVDCDGWDSYMWYGHSKEPDSMIWSTLLDAGTKWRRRPDGAWERIAGVCRDWTESPCDLRMMLRESAIRIQKVWRGYRTRKPKTPTACHTPCSSTGT